MRVSRVIPWCILLITLVSPIAAVSQMETPLQVYGEGRITCADYSPNGKYLATGSWAGWVVLWDNQTGEIVRRLFGTVPVQTVRFSPDSQYVLTAAGTMATLWEVETGRAIRKFAEHEYDLWSAAWSPDGTKILTGSYQAAYLWDISTSQIIQTFQGFEGWAQSVDFSPDGGMVLTSGDDLTAKLWNPQTGALIRTFSGHQKWVGTARFSPDGKTILTGSWDGTAKLWDVNSGTVIHDLPGFLLVVNAVDFSPDGKTALTGGDMSLKLWDLETGQEIITYANFDIWLVSADFSPDGRTIAAASEDGVITLLDARNLEEKSYLLGHTTDVNSAVLSPDGKKVLIGSSDSIPKIWDTSTGEAQLLLTGIYNSINTVAFSPDGKTIAAGSDEFLAILWNAETGEELHVLSGHTNSILSVKFSPDGKTLLTGSGDATARLWDVETGEEIRTFSGHTNQISSVAFSPDGSRILTGGLNSAKLWDAETGQELYTFTGQAMNISSVSFSSDGRYALMTNNGVIWDVDNTAIILDLESGEIVHTFSGEMYIVMTAVFTPDETMILTAGDNAQLWDIETETIIRTFSGHTVGVASAAISPDGSRILTGSWDNTARLWDAATGQVLFTITGHKHDVNAVAFSPDGTMFLTGGWDGTVRLWNTATGEEIRVFAHESTGMESGILLKRNSMASPTVRSTEYALPGTKHPATVRPLAGHEDWIRSVAFSKDGTKILSGSDDNTAKLWDALSGEVLMTFSGHADWVKSVAFSPDENTVLTGSDDGTARLWDIHTGEELVVFTGHQHFVESVAFSPDGKKILTGSSDATAKLWDAETGQEILTFSGHESAVMSVAFSPDGSIVLTGSQDGLAGIWSAQTGQVLNALSGHTNYVNAVLFSPDGSMIATGSSDNTARLWNAATGQEILAFTGHADAVHSVAFSPDRKHLLTGSVDGTARLWEIDSPRVVIVAGGGDYIGNALVDQTIELAEYAYSICLARGYEGKDIRLLSAFDYQKDLDGDLQNDIHPLTKDSLRKTILEWSGEDLISPGRRLLIYMIDHGYPMTNKSTGATDIYFRLNHTQTIATRHLDSWLDQLSRPDMNLDVTLVVDCCYSGGFVKQCIPPEGYRRLLISSTTDETESMIMPPPDLTSFSYIFWGAAYMGATMAESTRTARNFFTSFGIAGQLPWLDDTGDGLSSALDGQDMGLDRFGRSWAYAGHGTGDVQSFEKVYPPENQTIQFQPGQSVELQVTLVPGSEPEAVWALLRPPAPERIAGTPLSSTESVRQISLTPHPSDPRLWSGTIESFTEEGLYIISYIARYAFDRLSRPKVVNFQVRQDLDPEQQVYQKALLISGGGERRELAMEMTDYARNVCLKRGYGSMRILGYPLAKESLLNIIRREAEPVNNETITRLLIYLIGDAHAGGEFLLNETERLTPADVMPLLNQLQIQYKNLEIILLVDCPYSGEFVSMNHEAPADRRVVLAGSRADERGFVLPGAEGHISFSRQVFNSGYQGYSLRESFQGAYLLLQNTLRKATPQLDDNGDGIWNKFDGQLAAKWYVGQKGVLAGPAAASLPALLEASQFSAPVSGSVPVWVDILDAEEPEQVSVIIIPEGIEKAGQREYARMELNRDGESWRWSGIIPPSMFDGAGNHSLLFMADYGGEQTSEPLITPVQIRSTAIHQWELW
ncbi:MAG: WD40 repeat domain-containing protein [bacterium]